MAVDHGSHRTILGHRPLSLFSEQTARGLPRKGYRILDAARLDHRGIRTAFLELAKHHTRDNAEQWRVDPKAAAEIEARLGSHGIDASSINIEVFVQARDLYIMFDSLIHSAQSRRIMLLREIATRRAFSQRAQTVVKRISELNL